MYKLLTVTCLLLSSVVSQASEIKKVKYLDYEKVSQEATITQDGKNISIQLKDFNYTVKLHPAELEDGVKVLTSDELPTNIRSKTHESLALHSLQVIMNSKNVKKVSDATRADLNYMQKEKMIKYSGEELCPSNATGTIVFAVRDFGYLTHCLIPVSTTSESILEKIKSIFN